MQFDPVIFYFIIITVFALGFGLFVLKNDKQ